ncbi:c-type cytochrome [Chitinivorax sp. B]|uniref:c-type cytochrome n=1 Tax=Chitinivorax sp. B TaxID=2502235 RepID=UPI0010F50D01|nr:c-type cytochrome [Chitinivorax sp. B]
MSNMSPKKLIGIIVASFVIPVVSIYLLVKLVSSVSSGSPDIGSLAMSNEAITARIQPVGVSKASVPIPAGSRSGEQVYIAICASCHATGAANSPKMGDSAAWASRISTGFQTLIDHAVKGFNAMPARGGSPDLTDDEVARAVAYMANKSGASFTEPKIAVGATATFDVSQAKQVVDTVCSTCHAAGVAGAPKLGDKASWAPRISGGMETLITSAIKGKGAMPAKGGYSGSDEEFKAIVEYMVDLAK